jgi:hypothetical protein
MHSNHSAMGSKSPLLVENAVKSDVDIAGIGAEQAFCCG